MEPTDKHTQAFEEFYASRNIAQVSRTLHISRASLHKWKLKFNWDAECEKRDKEVREQVQAVMIPQWAATKTLLIQTFLNKINAATKAEIAVRDIRDLVIASKEVRALMGEPDKHEILSTVKHKLTDDPDIMAAENDLLKLMAQKETDA